MSDNTDHDLTVPELERRVQALIDSKAKPLGALGRLETLARDLCLIQRTTQPVIREPHLFLFAGDHGIAEAGVSAYPRAVTAQMVLNFLSGGAAINVFATRVGLRLSIVNAGVATPLPEDPALIDAAIGLGTRNFLDEPAMSAADCRLAMDTGRDIVTRRADGNVVAFGEMGIGNTSGAALILHRLTNTPLPDCVGPGAGLDADGVAQKRALLEQAAARHAGAASPAEVLAAFGGFETAMMAGGMLAAAEQGKVILVDGFITTAALLIAVAMEPAVRGHCIFAHISDEPGHRHMLAHFHAEPLLQLGMRLGEGTGAAMALPLLHAAVDFMNEMASFEDAGVSRGTP